MKEDSSGQVRIAKSVQEKVSNGSFDTKGCTHIAQIKDVTPSAVGCEECLKIGDTWVHLRLCLTCGHVGCCDNSKNKHATKHNHATQHPLIVSYEPDESWLWCYSDSVFLQP